MGWYEFATSDAKARTDLNFLDDFVLVRLSQHLDRALGENVGKV